ncbi:hypothetical protein C5167_019232 [Papaver somniferum]|uniref:Uncharacterized protein n=1 Tax=Papaver somniferum TaxID=3469 RepID=A0A4Y7ISV6_PAPSO|nr:hypothetical protein C5167_019232 [Papaver somniferum]
MLIPLTAERLLLKELTWIMIQRWYACWTLLKNTIYHLREKILNPSLVREIVAMQKVDLSHLPSLYLETMWRLQSGLGEKLSAVKEAVLVSGVSQLSHVVHLAENQTVSCQSQLNLDLLAARKVVQTFQKNQSSILGFYQ